MRRGPLLHQLRLDNAVTFLPPTLFFFLFFLFRFRSSPHCFYSFFFAVSCSLSLCNVCMTNTTDFTCSTSNVPSIFLVRSISFADLIPPFVWCQDFPPKPDCDGVMYWTNMVTRTNAPSYAHAFGSRRWRTDKSEKDIRETSTGLIISRVKNWTYNRNILLRVCSTHISRYVLFYKYFLCFIHCIVFAPLG